jgi:hypothetical protein
VAVYFSLGLERRSSLVQTVVDLLVKEDAYRDDIGIARYCCGSRRNCGSERAFFLNSMDRQPIPKRISVWYTVCKPDWQLCIGLDNRRRMERIDAAPVRHWISRRVHNVLHLEDRLFATIPKSEVCGPYIVLAAYIRVGAWTCGSRFLHQ